MKMKELEKKSGLARTTIHYYLREGLLPQPEKTATNTGKYSREHLEKLEFIARLRGYDAGPFPIYLVKKILELVDQGVNPEVAIALEKAVLNGNYTPDNTGPFTLETLAAESGIPHKILTEYIETGLLLPVPGSDPRQFDQLDMAMANTFREILDRMGWSAEDVSPISKKIREISDYEWSLRNKAIKGHTIADAAEMRSGMQEFANFMHRYFFYRARLINIESEQSEQATN